MKKVILLLLTILTMSAGAHAQYIEVYKNGVCKAIYGSSYKVVLSADANGLTTYSDLIQGAYSVSADKKVQFTKGNLYADNSTNRLESSQTATTSNRSNSEHISHFFWTYSREDSYKKYYDASELSTDNIWCRENAYYAVMINGHSGYYTLTKSEWEYLYNTRDNHDRLHMTNVTINNGNKDITGCLVIAPDDFSGTLATTYTAEQWAAAEAAGCVCLPPGGQYNSVDQTFSDASKYWLNTIGDQANSACYLDITTGMVREDTRRRGLPIRLVRTIPTFTLTE